MHRIHDGEQGRLERKRKQVHLTQPCSRNTRERSLHAMFLKPDCLFWVAYFGSQRLGFSSREDLFRDGRSNVTKDPREDRTASFNTMILSTSYSTHYLLNHIGSRHTMKDETNNREVHLDETIDDASNGFSTLGQDMLVVAI